MYQSGQYFVKSTFTIVIIYTGTARLEEIAVHLLKVVIANFLKLKSTVVTWDLKEDYLYFSGKIVSWHHSINSIQARLCFSVSGIRTTACIHVKRVYAAVDFWPEIPNINRLLEHCRISSHNRQRAFCHSSTRASTTVVYGLMLYVQVSSKTCPVFPRSHQPTVILYTILQKTAANPLSRLHFKLGRVKNYPIGVKKANPFPRCRFIFVHFILILKTSEAVKSFQLRTLAVRAP